MLVVTIDPGLRGCGCAWWRGERPSGGKAAWALLRAAYVPALEHEPEDGRDEGAVAWMAAVGAVTVETRRVFREASSICAHVLPQGVGPDVVAVEAMKVYTRGEGDPADLVALAAIAGGVLAAFPSARPIALRAGEWKGQVPRKVMGERVVAKLRGERPLPPGVTAGWPTVDPWTARSKDRLNDAAHAVGLGLFLFERGRV